MNHAASMAWTAASRAPVESPNPEPRPELAAAQVPPPGYPTCEELARRAKAGDGDAFAELIDRHGARVHGFLLRFVGHAHDAQDLTQETFLRAFRGLARHPAPRAFVPWLMTIARRTALNHFRARRPAVELRDNLPEERPDSDPARGAERSDDRDALWSTARRLKPKQFQALWLRYNEGLSLEEVASAMGANPVYVKVLLHRARLRLAEWLEHSELNDRPNRRA